MGPKLTSFNNFRLFALGYDFDVDNYVRMSPLSFTQVWYRGLDSHKLNGVMIELGDGRILNTSEQEETALQFLGANAQALHELGHRADVTTFTLGIHYRLELHPKSSGLCLSTNRFLISAAALLNANVNYYVEFDRVEPRRQRR